MKLRHRRKAKQAATNIRRPAPAFDRWSMTYYRHPGKSVAMRLLQEIAAKQDAARTPATCRIWFDECLGESSFELPLDPAFQSEIDQRYLNTLVHGHSHPEHFLQEFPSWPPTAVKQAGQHVVQQAEVYDRQLPHYFRDEARHEAIPLPWAMAESNRYYDSLIEVQAGQLDKPTADVRRAALEYSRSNSYTQWLRENRPK